MVPSLPGTDNSAVQQGFKPKAFEQLTLTVLTQPSRSSRKPVPVASTAPNTRPHQRVSTETLAENLNISTLIIVADGRIFLCARDNHRETVPWYPAAGRRNKGGVT